MRPVRFGFPAEALLVVVLAIGTAMITAAIVTGAGATLVWRLTYGFIALSIVAFLILWAHSYRRAGGHLRNEAWTLYRDLEAFAKSRKGSVAITEDEKLRAEVFWGETQSLYAKRFTPRAYRIRRELQSHGWADEAFWDRRALFSPESVDDIRFTAEMLRSVSLNLR